MAHLSRADDRNRTYVSNLEGWSNNHYTTSAYGAKDRARTGHPDLGKVVLYQMSYFRKSLFQLADCTGLEPVNSTVTGWHDNQLHQQSVVLIHFYMHHPCHALVDIYLNELVF